MWVVKWTELAESQLIDTLNFWIIHNNSNAYSVKLLNSVDEVIKRISDNPYVAQQVIGKKNGITFNVRRCVVLSNFSIIYRITNVIEIIAFWDNRQSPKSLKDIVLGTK